MNTSSLIILEATEEYLKNINKAALPARHMRVEQCFCQNLIHFANENANRSKGEYLKIPDRITPWQIGRIIAETEFICCIRCVSDSSNDEHDLLGIYQETGPNAGTYDTKTTSIYKLIREYDNQLTEMQIKAIVQQLREDVPHLDRHDDPDLIAVNNGLFNFRTKQLEPFTPYKIFLSKSHVDYNPNAQLVPLYNHTDGTYWDIDSWIRELANDDPEIELCIWQCLSAIVRPHVRWNKAAFFYSTTGNNGKGTLCALMRNLVGAAACANIPLADFSKDFILEPLIESNCVIVDENDVGGYIDKAGNLKAVITGDTVQINRKYKVPIYYQFHGFMVQCINELPRVKDKSNSFYRRQLFVPFQKCFTGRERTYIKNDYLYRPDVLEYVMHKVLHMDHYQIITPKASEFVMSDYQIYNDPVREFCEEILHQLVWDLVPYQFLYDCYFAWCSHNRPSSKIQGKTTFTKDLQEVIKEYSDDWMDCPRQASDGRPSRFHTQGNMNGPELLIAQYNLDNWKNKGYMSGMDIKKLCTYFPSPSERLSGIIRVGSPLADQIEKSQQGGDTA